MRKLFPQFTLLVACLFALVTNTNTATAKIPYWAGYETKGYVNDEYDGNV